MGNIIKISGNAKIYGNTVIQFGTPPIDYDTILLEDESGFITQEISGQIALELQEN